MESKALGRIASTTVVFTPKKKAIVSGKEKVADRKLS
jgi:hypothetical protein